MKENSISYKTAKQETERLICEIEEITITHRAYTAECLRRVLKENEELKKFHIQDNKHLDFIMQHSIPVQKVKDKIEEILNNGEYRIIFEGDAEFPDEATCIDAQKYIKLEKLQELLEGRK